MKPLRHTTIVLTLLLTTLSCTSSSTSSTCGNGQLESGEACDDANTAPEDGCSSTCAVEDNWGCDNLTMPSSCQPLCTPSCGEATCGDDGCDDSDESKEHPHDLDVIFNEVCHYEMGKHHNRNHQYY